MIDRRHFIGLLAATMSVPVGAAARRSIPSATGYDGPSAQPKISLAQWSLHTSLFGKSWAELSASFTIPQLVDALRDRHAQIVAGPLDPLDFAPFTRDKLGITAVEYVNTFYFDKARNDAYVARLDRQAREAGVENVLVMCDGLGNLAAAVEKDRLDAVEDHVEWLAFASTLGCKSLRVNARPDMALPREEQSRLAADGLRHLCEKAESAGLNVIVENHGGLSSDGAWLADTIRRVDHPLIGTLPDFGNFTIAPGRKYDRYQGVAELMPFARGVSAKAYQFDPQTGLETTIDYERLLRIVRASGFNGHIGIEYEGKKLSEVEGILATKRLIERIYGSVQSEGGYGGK